MHHFLYWLNEMHDSHKKTIPYLDGWRGLAIISVLICHFGPRPALSFLGNIGVQMFFVLSGYLMGNVLFIKKVQMPDFFARRLSRIIPTFLLFVTAMYIYAGWLQAERYAVPIDELLATLAFLRTYLPSQVNIWSNQWAIGNLWSLNVEEHSYILLAVVAVLVHRLKHRMSSAVALIAATGVIIGLCLYYPNHPPPGASPWFLRSECAALGLIAAAAVRQVRHVLKFRWSETVHPLLPVIWTVIGFAGLSYFTGRGGQFVFAPIGLALAINYFHCAPESIKWLLSNRVFRWFGRCSFSLYLWQQPIFLAVSAHSLPKLLGAFLAIALGAASFYLFEDPIRSRLNTAWGNRYANASTTQASSVDQTCDPEKPSAMASRGKLRDYLDHNRARVAPRR